MVKWKVLHKLEKTQTNLREEDNYSKHNLVNITVHSIEQNHEPLVKK